jgi:peptide/nickel transport system substrate-binding protein
MKPETPAQREPYRRGGNRQRRRMLSTLLGLASAVALAAGLSACGGGGTTASAKPAANTKPSPAAAGTKPAQRGTIYYAHDLEVPCLQGGWVEENYIERQYADSLVSQVSSGHLVPWLATSWSISKNQETYTFHLKPDVKFSDGTPLNAQAVVDNFYFWTNPKSGNSDVNAYIGPYFKSAKALNNLTVEVNLKAPYSPLLSSLSQSYDGILSPKGLARGIDANCVDPIGSGPFIIQKWNHGQNIVFVRNPNYNSWPANALHKGPPHVSKLVWSFVSEPTTRWASLTTGQSDVIEDVPTVDFPQAKSQYNLAEYVTPGRPQTLSLNTDLGPFTDVLVRQAFAYAINRRAAVQSAFNGAIPYDGNGALSPSTPDYDTALNNSFPYNPAKAAALLNQAGWTTRDAAGYRTKDGKELNITLVYGLGSIVNDEGATLLEDLQQEWKAVGFNVKLLPATLTQLFGGQFDTPKGYDATIGYWTSPTPAVLYITYLPWNAPGDPNYSNSTFYDSAQLVKTIADANSSLNPATQDADYTKAQELIVNQAVAVGLYTKTTTLAWSKNLHDVWIEDSQGDPVFADAYITK